MIWILIAVFLGITCSSKCYDGFVAFIQFMVFLIVFCVVGLVISANIATKETTNTNKIYTLSDAILSNKNANGSIIYSYYVIGEQGELIPKTLDTKSHKVKIVEENRTDVLLLKTESTAASSRAWIYSFGSLVGDKYEFKVPTGTVGKTYNLAK